jgi:hypothetical protein
MRPLKQTGAEQNLNFKRKTLIMKPQLTFLKGIIMPLLIACAISSAQAQEQQAAGENSISPKFGIKAGVNLANLYVDNVEDENMKVGLNAGLVAKIPLVKGLSIQPELLFSSKGAKLRYNNLLFGGGGEYRFNLNYVEVPLLAVVNIAKNLNLHAGGYGSYLVSVNTKDLDDDGTITDISKLNAENFNRLDYGLVGGLGVDVSNFSIGARYNYGLREVGKAGEGGASKFTQNSKNSVITLYIALGF